MIILLILAYISAGLIQGSSLIKKKYWKELIIFSAFLAFSFVLSLLYILDVDIPSPAKLIQYVIEDILHIKYPQ